MCTRSPVGQEPHHGISCPLPLRPGKSCFSQGVAVPDIDVYTAADAHFFLINRNLVLFEWLCSNPGAEGWGECRG